MIIGCRARQSGSSPPGPAQRRRGSGVTILIRPVVTRTWLTGPPRLGIRTADSRLRRRIRAHGSNRFFQGEQFRLEAHPHGGLGHVWLRGKEYTPIAEAEKRLSDTLLPRVKHSWQTEQLQTMERVLLHSS